MASQGTTSLTRREGEILALIGRGFDSREIALVLGIAYFTVRKHRSNMLAKLNLSSAARLAAHAAAIAPDRAPAPSSHQAGTASAHTSSSSPIWWRAASPASRSPALPPSAR